MIISLSNDQLSKFRTDFLLHSTQNLDLVILDDAVDDLLIPKLKGYFGLYTRSISSAISNSIETLDVVIICECPVAELHDVYIRCHNSKVPILRPIIKQNIAVLHINHEPYLMIDTYERAMRNYLIDCPWPELNKLIEKAKFVSNQVPELPFEPILYAAWILKQSQDIQSWHQTRATGDSSKQAFNYIGQLQRIKRLSSEFVLHQNQEKDMELHILFSSLQEFIKNTGRFPIISHKPDIKIQDSDLIKIIEEKEADDLKLFKQYVLEWETANSMQLEDNNDERLRIFIAKALQLRTLKHGNRRSLKEELSSNDNKYMIFYILALLYESITENNKENCHKQDLAEAFQKILGDQDLSIRYINYIEEFCKREECSTYSINCYIAAIATQETTKIITKRYKPIDNVLLFDGCNLHVESLSSSTAYIVST